MLAYSVSPCNNSPLLTTLTGLFKIIRLAILVSSTHVKFLSILLYPYLGILLPIPTSLSQVSLYHLYPLLIVYEDITVRQNKYATAKMVSACPFVTSTSPTSPLAMCLALATFGRTIKKFIIFKQMQALPLIYKWQ